ncbi:MAG: YggS family pyridoxal phosphate-dependent enzyme [Planctomycetota bacterium]
MFAEDPSVGLPPALPAVRARLEANIAVVRAAIAAAAERARRPAAEVRLVAVTKYVGLDVVGALLSLGVRDLGENQVQQLVARAARCGQPRHDWPGSAGDPADPRPRWHLIGHLQRNKVKLLLPYARIVHGLDSVRLAEALEQRAAELEAQSGAPVQVDVLLEVNVSGEVTKQGVAPAEVPALAAAVLEARHLRLRGLMTMAPYATEAETSRPHFARLRELRDELRARGALDPGGLHLSMGMTQDYTVAVEEGATLVRVGSALYSGLPSADPRSPG